MRLLPREPRSRRLALAQLVNMSGGGLFFAGGAVFLTMSVGLSAGQVGIGLTGAGLIGLLGGMAFGHLADRWTARDAVIVCLVLEVVGAVGLAFVTDTPTLVVAAGIAAIGRRGRSSAVGALTTVLAGPDERTELRAYLRAVANVGLAVGSIGAGIVLAINTRTAYLAMIGLIAAAAASSAVMLTPLPRSAPYGKPSARPRPVVALRDRRYMLLSAANGVMSLHYSILTVALPLWIAGQTQAPTWSSAILFLINAVAIAALQVIAARRIDDTRKAARMLVRSGPVFAAGWLLMGLAQFPTSAGVALTLLLVAVAAHSIAEVWQVAGGFELSFALAPDGAHGLYQGIFGIGVGVAQAVAPGLLVTLCVVWGLPGWLMVGAMVIVAGLVIVALERRHPAMASPAAVPAVPTSSGV